MSAGLGTLQRNIINEVEINSPIYQRELMWQLAFDRGAIMKTGTAWNDIEEGSITASFKENFRRAIRSLDEQHAIIKLVNQILHSKQNDVAFDITNIENEINQKVYKIYGLIEDEITIIENSI